MNSKVNVNKKCPKCGRYYSEPPALSRVDNKTKICSMCGMKEALKCFMVPPNKNN